MTYKGDNIGIYSAGDQEDQEMQINAGDDPNLLKRYKRKIKNDYGKC